jgi:hypothetical protein
MNLKLLVGILGVLVAWAAPAQDEAQRSMREQDQQRNNWYWHQMQQGATNDFTQQLPPSPPRPSGEWIKTWGAIADGNNGEGGISVGKFTKQDAITDAISQCKRGGGVDCKPTFTYYNQCMALTAASVASSGSLEKAQKLAAGECKKNDKNSCDIIYSACTEPYFKKYN